MEGHFARHPATATDRPQKLLSHEGLTLIPRSHPDVQKFKPTALRLAKQYVSRTPRTLKHQLIVLRRVRHRGPDWSESRRKS